jgi:hypothetical protein
MSKVVKGMYKKALMFSVAALFLLSTILPATAVDVRSPLKSDDTQDTIQGKALAGLAFLKQSASDLRLQRTKTFTISGIDAAINVLKASANGVERSRLTDAQKATLKSEIDSNITWFEARKQDAQASKDVAGVLQIAKQASDRWNDVYPGLKKESGFMACDNFDSEICRARSASDIVSAKIRAMKAQGKDTGKLEKAMASYGGHVDKAAGYSASARAEFSAIGPGAVDGHFAAGLRQLGLAQGEMNKAFTDLKAIYRLFFGESVRAT